MTANDTKVPGVGASSPAALMWDQANWPRIEAEVKRLQMRIAKRCRNRHLAEGFLIGDRGRSRVSRPVGASPRSVIKKTFVLNRSAGARFYGH
ncbi:hypothetical protein D9M70_144520 [compost metagenome]